MENLKAIFNERDDVFSKRTHKIFSLINTTLVCVTEFLNTNDPMFQAGSITWEEVELEEDLVSIMGFIEYEPGTTVEVDNNIISVTSENIDYFQRIIHMSLPYELVVESDGGEILKFLQKLKDDGKGDDFGKIIAGAPDGSIDFDFTKLTKAQQAALIHDNIKTKN